METIALHNTLCHGMTCMFAAQHESFTDPRLIFAIGSIILLLMISLLQDIVQRRMQFSLAQFFFFTAVFASMLGAAVNVWRILGHVAL